MAVDERWASVDGYEGIYEVSDLGRIRSIERLVASRWGTLTKAVSGVVKTPRQQREGYLYVHLYKDGKARKRYIHRLVAKAFVLNPGDLPQVNHMDGDKTNNAHLNLEWVTGKGNCEHAIRNRLYEPARGEQSGHAKLSEDDVLEIRRSVACGELHREAALRFGVGRKAVTKIVSRQRWSHVA